MEPKEAPKTTISLDGIKPGSVFHLANRARKALREDGRSTEGDELYSRCINDNVRFTFDEVLAIVREYVEVTGEVPLKD